MTDTLNQLARRVEAGDATAREIGPVLGYDYHEHATAYANISSAICGSLDAAKALHDAVLPEDWRVDIQFCAGRWFVITSNDIFHGPAKGWEKQGSGEHKTNPAAAWVAAILRAKAAEESNG